MASIVHGDVSEFMGLPIFAANTKPTATQVGALIDEADSLIDEIEVEISLTSNQQKILARLRVAAWVARARGLFVDGVATADSYMKEYNDIVKEIKAGKQQSLPNQTFAYGQFRKVNR